MINLNKIQYTFEQNIVQASSIHQHIPKPVKIEGITDKCAVHMYMLQCQEYASYHYVDKMIPKPRTRLNINIFFYFWRIWKVNSERKPQQRSGMVWVSWEPSSATDSCTWYWASPFYCSCPFTAKTTMI